MGTESRGDPTRREFLLKLAKGAAYSAPVVQSFAVAPALVQGKSSQHKQKTAAPTAAPEQPARPGAELPSEKHPPPGGGPSREKQR